MLETDNLGWTLSASLRCSGIVPSLRSGIYPLIASAWERHRTRRKIVPHSKIFRSDLGLSASPVGHYHHGVSCKGLLNLPRLIAHAGYPLLGARANAVAAPRDLSPPRGPLDRGVYNIVSHFSEPVQTSLSSDLAMALIVIAKASLSFLGVGVPPAFHWGTLLAARASTKHAWWLPLFPGLCIFITVLGINLLGDALRDILDPRLKRTGLGL